MEKMNTQIMKIGRSMRLLSLFAAAACSLAMGSQQDWENENVISINKELPRATLIPYASVEQAIESMRGGETVDDPNAEENRQALEMAKVYSDIQSGMMDAFASVISNNLNVIMKQLTSVTIVLMIPTLIASLYGMNVSNQLERSPYAFYVIILISVFTTLIGIFLFKRRNWF